MAKRILIVDDEPRYLRLLEANLRTEGYEVVTGMPMLMVTGRLGACGNTNRIRSAAGSPSSGTTGSKSWPSAPRPCNQITAASGDPAVSTSIVSGSGVTPALAAAPILAGTP